MFGMRLPDCRSLARALESTETLTYLNLSGNGLDDDKARMVLSGMVDNISITHLDLSQNKIADRGVRALAKLLDTDSVISILNLRRAVGLPPKAGAGACVLPQPLGLAKERRACATKQGAFVGWQSMHVAMYVCHMHSSTVLRPTVLCPAPQGQPDPCRGRPYPGALHQILRVPDSAGRVDEPDRGRGRRGAVPRGAGGAALRVRDPARRTAVRGLGPAATTHAGRRAGWQRALPFFAGPRHRALALPTPCAPTLDGRGARRLTQLTLALGACRRASCGACAWRPTP